MNRRIKYYHYFIGQQVKSLTDTCNKQISTKGTNKNKMNKYREVAFFSIVKCRMAASQECSLLILPIDAHNFHEFSYTCNRIKARHF